jgi:acyl-CoA synthetase (AMP-forming)/AMP-acid ligase II/acyl carrier protein
MNLPASGRFTSLHEMLRWGAETYPEHSVIRTVDGRCLSYAQLYEFTENIKRVLRENGVAPSDRIAIVLANGPEMAVAFLSLAASCATAPLNPTYRRDEFEFYLSDLQAKALVVQAGAESPAIEAATALDIPIIALLPASDSDSAGLFTLEFARSDAPIEAGFTGADDIALLLHTSGTTSRPKLVPLTQANLSASAANIRETLHLTQADSCLNVMPLFHIHGLMGVLMTSIASGASVICSPGFNAPHFFEWMDRSAPTWYSAVPSIHQSILLHAPANQEIIARHSLRFVRSSSAALPLPVIEELGRVFSAPVIEAYGMTEASHQMASNPLPPARRKAGSVGHATGIEIAIMDEAGILLPPEKIGEIVIRGRSVTASYVSNPAANGIAFTNGWFLTGDQGYLDSDGYLYISGRIKEIINRGGEKISPREVDEVLLKHPQVAQAVTFAMPDARLGEEVAAAVVLRSGGQVSERALRDFVAESLAEFKVPRRVVILGEIPKGPTGKIQRIGLAEKLGIHAPDDDALTPIEYTAPTNPIEEMLAGFWAEVLGIEQVGIHHPFMSLGGDSLLAAQIVSRLQNAADIKVTLRDFFDTPTVASMAAVIEQILLEEIDQASEG